MKIEYIEEAAAYIKNILGEDSEMPTIGIVLGSGLGDLADEITDPIVISYGQIPHFRQSTAQGHKGNLICGKLNGKKVIAMQGRFHFYEGYHMDEVTLPIRVMSLLGVRHLLVSNAAGAMNPTYRVGDLVIITDHISFMPNPLIGPNMERFGVRFPDMTTVYSKRIRAIAHEAADHLKLQLREGIYVAETGPTYETPAEYRMYAMLGGDLVGMSTVPEVIVARHCGMEIFGMSVVTNQSHDLSDDCLNSGDDVIAAANAATKSMTSLFSAIVEKI